MASFHGWNRVDHGTGVHTRVGEQGQDVLEIGAHVGLAGTDGGTGGK
jgi:hypothetical protein